MDAKNVVLLGGAGAVAWWFFLRSPAPAAAVTPGTPAAVTPDPNAIVGGSSLDGMYAKMLERAKTMAGAGASSLLGVDDWNYFLMQGSPSVSAPDPMPLFQAAVPGFDRAQKITASQYWTVMRPALATQLGLSGFAGLGYYGKLAELTGGGW